MPITFTRRDGNGASVSFTRRFRQRAPRGSAIAAVDAEAIQRFTKAGLIEDSTVQNMFKALSAQPVDFGACKQAKRKAYALLHKREATMLT